MKILVILCFALLFAVSFSFVAEEPKSCKADDRILKHNQVGPAPLGSCMDVQCVNGELQPLIGCGLVYFPNCPKEKLIEDLTKLYPNCCATCKE